MDYSKFYTPPGIAKSLINELNIDAPLKVVDICCGSCNLLFAAKERWNQTKLYGVDVADHSSGDVIFERKDGRQFAIDHSNEFSLVVANPPFDYVEASKQFPELFIDKFKNYKTSRLEIEMLLANLRLLQSKGTLLIILPSSFVEAMRYNQIRKIIAANYFIESIIKLDENTFGASKINSYALIIHNESQNQRSAKIGVAVVDEGVAIEYKLSISSVDLVNGNWTTRENCTALNFLDIRRGNISSSSFTKRGQPILHTSKYSDDWEPSRRYISKKIAPTVFADEGDIVISRIGKSAGQWCVHSGERMPISDCLYRIKDPDGSIFKRINGQTFNLDLKGVATRYITIVDFCSWMNSISQENY